MFVEPFTAPSSKTKGQTAERPRGFRDPRGQLFWHIVRLLIELGFEPNKQPKAVLLENVPGLCKNDISRVGAESFPPLHETIEVGRESSAECSTPEEPDCGEGYRSPQQNSALACVLYGLSRAGYSCSWRIYSAEKVVPQERPRLYVVGIRNDLVVCGDAPVNGRLPFEWPTLPNLTPQIHDILHPAPCPRDDSSTVTPSVEHDTSDEDDVDDPAGAAAVAQVMMTMMTAVSVQGAGDELDQQPLLDLTAPLDADAADEASTARAQRSSR